MAGQGQEEPLSQMAVHRAQQGQLLGLFDAFGDDFEGELVGKPA